MFYTDGEDIFDAVRVLPGEPCPKWFKRALSEGAVTLNSGRTSGFVVTTPDGSRFAKQGDFIRRLPDGALAVVDGPTFLAAYTAMPTAMPGGA